MKRFFWESSDFEVSEKAGVALENDIEDYGFRVSEAAIDIAAENGRKTVRKCDIRKAAREVEG